MNVTTLHIDTRALPVEQARQFLRLVERANRGDESAMPDLVRMLDAVPALARQLGDVAEMARTAWEQRFAGDQLATAEAIRLETEALRAELTQPAGDPLERLLIDRILVCRLHLAFVEASYARQLHELSVEWTDAHQKRIDRAGRRFVQAVRALAQVRRLAVPPVQVNIAEQQVNQVNADIRTVA